MKMNMNRMVRIIRYASGVLAAAVTVGLLWPVHSLFARIKPFVLGLPLSFAWVILCLILMFFALPGFYLADKVAEKNTGS